MVGEEHHVAARQALQHLVALDLDVVEDREVGDGEADAEAREQPAPQPAAEEGAGDDGLGEGRRAGRPCSTGSASRDPARVKRPPDASRPESYTRARPRSEEADAPSRTALRRRVRPSRPRQPGRRRGEPPIPLACASRCATPSRSRRGRSTAACCCCSRPTPRPSRASRSRDTTCAKSQQVFGIDVVGWKPGEPAVFDASVLGFPAESLADVKPGRYRVQALLHRYETFHRADGHVVKLPMDRGEGQQWNRAPGNLLSAPREIAIDPAQRRDARDRARPGDPGDQAAGRHEATSSTSASRASGSRSSGAGRCTSGAVVLLPHGFDEHPEARFPLAVFHGHFPYTVGRLPRGAARPEPALRVLRPLPPRLLQPDPAAARPRALPGLDGARLPALPGGRDPAREPVLRRLLRGELREPRPLRRRDPVRAHPRDRAPLPRHRTGLGALHVRRLDRRLGGARGAGALSRTSGTAAGPPAPTRSTSAPT